MYEFEMGSTRDVEVDPTDEAKGVSRVGAEGDIAVREYRTSRPASSPAVCGEAVTPFVAISSAEGGLGAFSMIVVV